MRFSAVGFGVFLALAGRASAQVARVEGDLVQSGDGAPMRAKLFFQAPDSLKIEVLDARGAAVQTVIAGAGGTQTFDARTGRVGVSPVNIAREWFRGAGLLAGGPGNFALVGATGFVAGPDQGISRVRDRVLLGNDENRAYYVASKLRVRAFPARIEVANGVRTDFDDLGTPVLRAQVSLDAQHLPRRAVVGAGADAVTFDYTLKARATDFPDGTFSLPDAAKDAIREDAVLRAPSSYGDASTDEVWNHGLALWRASGDATGALALWARATLSNPRATAPRFSSLEVALATRSVTGAARALDGLRPLLSPADFAWASISTDVLRADRAALLRDLESAASTGEPERQLALSLAERAAGDLSRARATWIALLSPSVPHSVTVKAAENLALSATQKELSTLGQTLAGEGEGVVLARALLDLRGGKTSGATFEASSLRASFARALERAGRSDQARPLWESLEENDSLGVQNEARAHIITILARSGDAGGALGAWNRWNATLAFETAQENARNILFDAFQKAGKIDALRVLLLNRARATGAKDLDLRLNLSFQEDFGDDDAINKAQGAGVERFASVPFWGGKRAETLVKAAFLLAPDEASDFRRRAALFKGATALLDDAIQNSPEPTFYLLQKALVQIQRATGTSGLVNPADSENSKAIARAQLTRLDAGDDPDALVVAALGWNSFPSSDDRAHTLESARRALDSAPIDGDRATLVFAARQASARVLESTGDDAGATRQWVALLDVAPTAGDEAGLIAVLLNGLERRKNSAGMAQILVRVAGEHWPFDANSGLLSGASGRVAASPLFADILKSLDALAGAPDAKSSPQGALVARAALSLARFRYAGAVVAVPGAPPSADAELERATRDLTPAFAALQPVVEADDPFWGTRARLLLIEAAILSPDSRRALLEQLAVLQGGEPSVALGLANSDADPQTRVKVAQTLDFRLQSWRRLAFDALDSGDTGGAEFWSREAFEFAASAPEISADDFQSIAFARARVLWSNQQIPAATALYDSLAGAGWNVVARAAALMAQQRRLQKAGRADEAKSLDARFKPLNLSKDDLISAASLLDQLDG